MTNNRKKEGRKKKNMDDDDHGLFPSLSLSLAVHNKLTRMGAIGQPFNIYPLLVSGKVAPSYGSYVSLSLDITSVVICLFSSILAAAIRQWFPVELLGWALAELRNAIDTGEGFITTKATRWSFAQVNSFYFLFKKKIHKFPGE